MSEVRGGSREELSRVQGQGQPGEATSHPRPGVVTLRSHPEPKARGGSWEEPPRARGQRGDPEEPPRARGQGRQLGRSHPRPRLGLAARRSNPRSGG